MKKGIALLALTSSFTLLAAHTATAGNLPGSITITPGAGYYFFDDRRNLDDTGLGNLGLAYNFDRQWAIEAIYAPFNTKRNHTGGATIHTHGNLYLLDGLYRFYSYKMFEPYVSAGLGALSISRNANTANTLANINAAIGAQVFFDKHIALRAEARDLYTLTGGFNDVMLNFGVSLLFGGKEPETAVYKDMAYKGDQ